MKPHVAVFASPAHGHINPTLAVSKELLSRGYRVTYAIPERYARAVQDLGADYVSYEVSRAHEGFAGDSQRTDAADPSVDIRLSLVTHERFKKDKPDVILFDSYQVSGTLMARNSPDTPSVKLFPSFAHNEQFPLSKGGFMAGEDWVERLVVEPIDRALPEERLGHHLAYHVSAVNIVFIPKFFQCQSETFDERFFFVGPSIAERPFYGKWSPPASAKNIVLISLGTVLNGQVDYFRGCMAALKDLDIYGVMTVGAGVDIEQLGEIPSNFEVHPFMSHLDVLPHASAFIGHGGMNSTMESLYYGVPMLLAPQDGHQRLIAQKVAELGLGRVLTAHTQNHLAQSLLTLLNDRLLIDRVKGVGAEMRKTSGAQVAADVVERAYRERWLS